MCESYAQYKICSYIVNSPTQCSDEEMWLLFSLFVFVRVFLGKFIYSDIMWVDMI